MPKNAKIVVKPENTIKRRGRPPGSKNKPKIIPQTPVVATVVTESLKPKDSVTVLSPVIQRRRGRRPKVNGKITVTEINNCPAEVDLDAAPDYGFYPINMSNFLFTEHKLLKVADFITSKMTPIQLSEANKSAKDADKDLKIFIICKILKAAGLYKEQINDVLIEIKEYKENNKPTQLYLKYKKR